MVHSMDIQLSPINMAKNMMLDGARVKNGDHLSTDSDILYK